MIQQGLKTLSDAGVDYSLIGHSALDKYYGNPIGLPVLIRTNLSLVELVARLDDVEYPSLPFCDIALYDHSILIQSDDCDHEPYFDALHLSYDPVTDWFRDPKDAYNLIRSRSTEEPGSNAPVSALLESAILAARYDFTPPLFQWPEGFHIDGAYERFVLRAILTGPKAHKGLQYLFDAGFVAAHWPELLPMNETNHSKEHHPEGNVWTHSLETLRYRKVQEERLSLALLLHDIGKPHAEREGASRFARHASIGAGIAKRFVRRLGYGEPFVADVAWLVQHHMIPGALDRLPISRIGDAMGHHLFPELLELFRCDLSSTFSGPEKYYAACRRYRSFLKHRKNPFRDDEGKKRFKLFVESA